VKKFCQNGICHERAKRVDHFRESREDGVVHEVARDIIDTPGFYIHLREGKMIPECVKANFWRQSANEIPEAKQEERHKNEQGGFVCTNMCNRLLGKLGDKPNIRRNEPDFVIQEKSGPKEQYCDNPNSELSCESDKKDEISNNSHPDCHCDKSFFNAIQCFDFKQLHGAKADRCHNHE